MATKKSSKGGSVQASKWKPKAKVKRPGVHSKKSTSGLKSSKNWKKAYRGQGR